MRAVIKIQMDNAAFEEPGEELAKILRQLSIRVEHLGCTVSEYPVIDTNGNRVGDFKIIGRRK